MTTTLFNKVADQYAKFRPTYPQGIYEFIASHVNDHDLAWDCATGSGQAAQSLAPYFKKVIATDVSPEQISHAKPNDRIEFRLAPAEHSGIADHTVDVTTVAQALHWLDFEKFVVELKRVSRKNAIFAFWNYGTGVCQSDVFNVIEDFNQKVLGPYWNPKIKHIETNYSSYKFPFHEISTPDYTLKTDWNIDQIIGYLSSWSAVQSWREANPNASIEVLREPLTKAWGSEATITFQWPIRFRAFRIK